MGPGTNLSARIQFGTNDGDTSLMTIFTNRPTSFVANYLTAYSGNRVLVLVKFMRKFVIMIRHRLELSRENETMAIRKECDFEWCGI
jgi:hypothetical protein